jgi:hypothetical protein
VRIGHTHMHRYARMTCGLSRRWLLNTDCSIFRSCCVSFSGRMLTTRI